MFHKGAGMAPRRPLYVARRPSFTFTLYADRIVITSPVFTHRTEYLLHEIAHVTVQQRVLILTFHTGTEVTITLGPGADEVCALVARLL